MTCVRVLLGVRGLMVTKSLSAMRTRTHLSIEGESGRRESITLGVVFGGRVLLNIRKMCYRILNFDPFPTSAQFQYNFVFFT